jgi:leucyl-tRNA synthetase
MLLCNQEWPIFDPAKTIDDIVEIAVQVMGKLRATVAVPRGSEDADVIAAALALEKIASVSQGATPKRSIVVKDKLVNLIF